MWHDGVFDPSGVVKGWSIHQASKMLDTKGFKNFYVDAGGDIEVCGKNAEGELWRIGIRNPFEKNS
ncbi:MAG: FAD:protein FMN transferase, partial [Patescibacteria group bacterium]